tara:strand:- start:708 stop:947 length:240 start_codon:yes stop_codon:yes gene_type:complete
MDDQDQIILTVYPHARVYVMKEGIDLLLPGGDLHSPVVREITFPNCKITLLSEEEGRLERISIQEIETPEGVVQEIPPL